MDDGLCCYVECISATLTIYILNFVYFPLNKLHFDSPSLMLMLCVCVPVCLSCLHRYLKLSIFFTLLLSFSPFLFRVLLFAVPSFASWPLRCLHLNRFSDQNFHHFHFLCITSIQCLRLAIRYLSSHSLPFTLCSFHVHEEYLYLVWRQSSFFSERLAHGVHLYLVYYFRVMVIRTHTHMHTFNVCLCVCAFK